MYFCSPGASPGKIESFCGVHDSKVVKLLKEPGLLVFHDLTTSVLDKIFDVSSTLCELVHRTDLEYA